MDDDLVLLMVRDAPAPPWTDYWLANYPLVRLAECAADDGADKWRQAVAQAADGCGRVVLVGAGIGAAACAAWYGAASLRERMRVAAAVLVPSAAALAHHAPSCRFQCRAAAVGDDAVRAWAAAHQARFFAAAGEAAVWADGWPWGMCLLQEMLM